MTKHALRSLAWLCLLLPVGAQAAEVNGYLDSRSQFSRSRLDGLLPTRDVPQLSELLEANVQVKQAYVERGFVYADLSLFANLVGNYRQLGPDGTEQVVNDHEVAAARPSVSLSELYLSHDVFPALNLLLGKKRVTWGSGMAFNPADLLNPPKDPTEPASQRTGAYMARVEVPLESMTFTLAASPAVLEQQSGIPYRFLSYPQWNKKDDQLHYQLAARAYALVADADLNLMAFYGNRYADAFEDKWRLGASFSRYFFTDYELHFEGLLQTGSSRTYAHGECLTGLEAAVGCLVQNKPLLEQSRLSSNTVYPRLLVGTRRQFNDDSMLSVEYLYQADGFTRSEFQDFARGLALQALARSAPLPPQATARLGDSSTGTPLRFSFEPLGRHYVFLSYQKPKIRDDFTVSAVVIANLQDFSGMVTPSVSWSTTEWLTLTLSGMLPFQGPRSLAASLPGSDVKVSEYELLPMQYRALFQARIFY